jgi:hypothetical protein
LTHKGIAATEFQAALMKAKSEIINDFTINGVPKSDFHQRALMAIGVNFRNGKAVAGSNVLTTADVDAAKAAAAGTPAPAVSGTPAPAAPTASSPRLGARPTAPAPAAPALAPQAGGTLTYNQATGKWEYK